MSASNTNRIGRSEALSLLSAIVLSTGNNEFSRISEELERLWEIERLARLVCGGVPTAKINFYEGRRIDHIDAINIQQKHCKSLMEAVK